MKNILGKIKLFIRNVWMLLAVDPLHKIIFSLSCAIFSLFIAEVMRNAFSRILIDLEGIRYVDKSNMIKVCTHPATVILVLLFLIIMTFSALFEIGGLLHSFSMAQIGRKTDIWSMIAAGAKTCRKTLSPRNWPAQLPRRLDTGKRAAPEYGHMFAASFPRCQWCNKYTFRNTAGRRYRRRSCGSHHKGDDRSVCQ